MLEVVVVRTLSVEADTAPGHLSAASGLVQVGQRLFVDGVPLCEPICHARGLLLRTKNAF